jgi:myo-inositol-1(or 4)-monophosphatase
MTPELSSRAAAAQAAVVAQTGFLHAQFGRVESRWKSDGSRVTAADLAISENIFSELASQFPEDQYFSEELPDPGAPIRVSARFSWVLDPIDGTNNFALGIPPCAISLALLEDGQPVYGVVYDLGRRLLMRGGPGFGMRDGDREARAITAAPHPESIIGFHSPFNKSLMPLAGGVLAKFKIRGLGSATLHLAYVAAGIFDGAVDYNVKVWDIAAAVALCRGAGAEVVFLSGDPFPLRQFDLHMKRIVFVAGGPVVADRLRLIAEESGLKFPVP